MDSPRSPKQRDIVTPPTSPAESKCIELTLSLGFALTITACARYVPPTDAQRLHSLQSLAHAVPSTQSTELTLKQRTAVLLTGSIEVKDALAQAQTLGVRFKTIPGRILNGPSHAIAIDPRGYFLTAAHCLHESSTYVVYFDGHSARIAIPRIVAKREDTRKHLDFAIIHIDATLPSTFEWSNETTPGRPAIATGSSSLYPDSGSQGFCTQVCIAGKISSTTRAPDGTNIIQHDLPLRPGDSGGPLATLEAKLLGINTGVHVDWTGTTTSIALRPDPTWVAQTIENDARLPHPPTQPIPLLNDKKAANLIVTLW